MGYVQCHLVTNKKSSEVINCTAYVYQSGLDLTWGIYLHYFIELCLAWFITYVYQSGLDLTQVIYLHLHIYPYWSESLPPQLPLAPYWSQRTHLRYTKSHTTGKTSHLSCHQPHNGHRDHTSDTPSHTLVGKLLSFCCQYQ